MIHIYKKIILLSFSMAICGSSVVCQQELGNCIVEKENPSFLQKAKISMQNHWDKYSSYYKYAATGAAILSGWVCAAYLYKVKVRPEEEAVRAVKKEIALEIQKILDDHPAIDSRDFGAEKTIEPVQANLEVPTIAVIENKAIQQPIAVVINGENQTTIKEQSAILTPKKPLTSEQKMVRRWIASEHLKNSTTFGDDISRGLGYVKDMFVQICANTFKGTTITRFR